MKRIHHIFTEICILSVLLIAGGPNGVFAADLEGHSQYRIISYSFSTDGKNNTADPVRFGPLLITGATSDIIGDGLFGAPEYGMTDPKSVTDTFALSADFSATPDLYLHGSIGMTSNRWDAAVNPDYNSSWEANLGVIYKLFNNIRYELHFGYMETGDLFKESNVYSDVESIIMISNKLTMSF